MDLLQIGLLFLAGGVAGFLAGFFGVGGGIILVPILLAYYQATGVTSLVATHLTLGTSLLVIIFASSSSAYQYSRNNHNVWRAVVLMGLGSIAGAIAGTTIAAALAGKALQRIFAGVVFFAAVRLLSEPRKPKGEPEMNLNAPGLLATGVIVGIVSALAGVGGGIFSIPIMYSLLHFPMKKALGTSSATIVITAFASVMGYVIRGWGNPLLPPGTLGYVDPLSAIPIIVGTLPTASLGARLAHRTHPVRLRRIFALFLVIIGIKMFFF
jgi:uncharacterized membrane protein YfcA